MTTLEAHTPGPWQAADVDETGGYDCMTAAVRVYSDGGEHIVATIDLSDYGQDNCGPIPLAVTTAVANGRLIAAAPELLDALEALHRYIEADVDGYHAAVDIMREAEAAIAKARGNA